MKDRKSFESWRRRTTLVFAYTSPWSRAKKKLLALLPELASSPSSCTSARERVGQTENLGDGVFAVYLRKLRSPRAATFLPTVIRILQQPLGERLQFSCASKNRCPYGPETFDSVRLSLLISLRTRPATFFEQYFLKRRCFSGNNVDGRIHWDISL